MWELLYDAFVMVIYMFSLYNVNLLLRGLRTYYMGENIHLNIYLRGGVGTSYSPINYIEMFFENVEMDRTNHDTLCKNREGSYCCHYP